MQVDRTHKENPVRPSAARWLVTSLTLLGATVAMLLAFNLLLWALFALRDQRYDRRYSYGPEKWEEAQPGRPPKTLRELVREDARVQHYAYDEIIQLRPLPYHGRYCHVPKVAVT